MQLKTLGEAKAAVAAGTAQQMTDTPFLPGREAIARITVSPNFNGTYKIQGSDDGTTYSDLLTVTGANQPGKEVQVSLKKYMRDNMTAFTAGSASAYLEA